MNRCCHIIIEGKYIGFRCNNISEINGYCSKCFERNNKQKNNKEIYCIGRIIDINDEYESFICGNKIVKDKIFCKRCLDNILRVPPKFNNSDLLLNFFCDQSNSQLFNLYYDKLTYTQDQLHNAIKIVINQKSKMIVLDKEMTNKSKFDILSQLLTTKYFPDKFNYGIFLEYNIDQKILSYFFYKRFLIRSLLESLNLSDCSISITDPFLNEISKPYYYTKYVLNKILFPGKLLYHNKIPKIMKENISNSIDIKSYDKLPKMIIYKDIYIIDIDNYIICKDINGNIYDLTDDDLSTLKLINVI